MKARKRKAGLSAAGQALISYGALTAMRMMQADMRALKSTLAKSGKAITEVAKPKRRKCTKPSE